MSTSNNKKQVPEGFIECYRCGQHYLTDMKRLHNDNGGQFIHFVALRQFIRIATTGPYIGTYTCVDHNECRMRMIYSSLRELGHTC